MLPGEKKRDVLVQQQKLYSEVTPKSHRQHQQRTAHEAAAWSTSLARA